MRPVRLEIRGFAAFREEQVIDFEDLDLFAITGETGAGKSSILDAVTFALFGEVPRLHGARGSIGSAITLGQPRMTVQFDFRARDEIWRVTRSTPLNGPSKVAFERWDGSVFVSAGEGSDRVKQATQMITEIIGLDYRAFTRSVLLPQGRFQEFLIGDASERRTILTELLGLELFGRLAKRASGSASEAKTLAEAKRDLFESEYAGITPEAIEEVRAEATRLRSTDRALATAESGVAELAEEARGASQRVRALASLVGAVESAVVKLDAIVAEARTAAVASTGADEERVAAAAVRDSAIEAQANADTALADAEKRWGNATELAKLLGRAEGFARDEAAIDAAEKELGTLEGQVQKLVAQADRRQIALDKAATAVKSATDAVDAALEAVEEARHGDLVAAVSSGLKAGDHCPVCGEPLSKAPPKRGVAALTKAEKARDAAHVVQSKAIDAHRKAEKDHEESLRAVDDHRARIESAGVELSERRTALAKAHGELAELEGDPLVVLVERIDALTVLGKDRDAARTTADDAERTLVLKQQAIDRADAARELVRTRLSAVDIDALLVQAAELVDQTSVPAPSQAVADDADAAAMADAADARIAVLAEVQVALAGATEEIAANEHKLVERAARIVGDLVAAQASVEDYVVALGSGRRDVAGTIARHESQAEEMARRIEAGKELQAEVAHLQQRAAVLGSLAKELRADRIVSFLQHEALIVLAVHASDHLMRMSGDAYRLTYEPDRDEFWVIDMANGEEERPARTLSGGETFLASLALALALSEGVQALAVEARPPLDSLFLDEGFGTLDQESLETVVQAIEHLGGDGRMVGVITHVRELALRLPARIEVAKSARGSRVSVMAGSIEG